MNDEGCKFLQEALAAKPVGGKSVYFYDDEAYEVDQNFNPPRAKKLEPREEEKAIAEKAAKLIARDYGEVLRRLENE